MAVCKFVLYGCVCLLAIAAAAPVAAQQGEISIYEPLVDRDARGFKEQKYEKDLTFCRNRAAPQENAARAGATLAASDYRLVLDRCLRRRGYVLLR